jgi:hypothetical protein
MRMFFVVAMGRSGTNFLAEILSKNPRGVVRHEPVMEDEQYLGSRHSGVFNTILDARMAERFRKILANVGDVEFYGEVNSLLRYEVEWLGKNYNPVLIHLVRDGRNFVRSAYIREVFTKRQYGAPVIPRDDDPFASSWAGFNRFQMLCWFWRQTNEYLAERVQLCARFEDVIGSYDAFRGSILEPTGVEISEELWRREVGRPKNTSHSFKTRALIRHLLMPQSRPKLIDPIPAWRDWNQEMTDQFWEICGPTMERFGYK